MFILEKILEFLWAIRIAIFMIIIAIIIFAIDSDVHSRSRTRTIQAKTKIEQVAKENKKLTTKLKNLEDRLEGIKDNNDLLIRDMTSYIDQRYRSIPKIVASEIAVNISKYSKQTKLPPELIMGIIETESHFNPTSISGKGARGLMQIMPTWAKKFNLDHGTDLHDINTNIRIGTEVLKIHISEQKGDVTKGLYKYSGGSKSYADMVYSAMGRFVAFRSTNRSTNNEKEELQK